MQTADHLQDGVLAEHSVYHASHACCIAIAGFYVATAAEITKYSICAAIMCQQHDVALQLHHQHCAAVERQPASSNVLCSSSNWLYHGLCNLLAYIGYTLLQQQAVLLEATICAAKHVCLIATLPQVAGE